MASCPITTRWRDGETMQTVTDFIFLCSQITADCDCSHEIKRRLLLGRKAMTNLVVSQFSRSVVSDSLWPHEHLDSILKSRDITLLTKASLVKDMVFPVVMYGCESWTIKKAEHQRIDAFELWCWRRLLGVPWTARRSNQSILKKINPEYSLEGLTLKLKVPILWPPDMKSWLRKDPDVRKDWRQQEKRTAEDEMVGWHHRFKAHEFKKALEDGEGQRSLVCCSPRGRKESDTSEWLTLSFHFPGKMRKWREVWNGRSGNRWHFQRGSKHRRNSTGQWLTGS